MHGKPHYKSTDLVGTFFRRWGRHSSHLCAHLFFISMHLYEIFTKSKLTPYCGLATLSLLSEKALTTNSSKYLEEGLFLFYTSVWKTVISVIFQFISV